MTSDERPLKEHVHGIDTTLRARRPDIESIIDELTARLVKRVGAELMEMHDNTVTYH